MALPHQPIVFLEKGFLIALCREMAKPFIEITAPKQNIVFLEELIFNRGSVYVDLSEAEILDLIQGNPPLDEDEMIAYPYLQKLANANKLKSCKEAVACLKSGEYKAMPGQNIHPNFLLLQEHKDVCKKLQDELGIICISTSFTTEEYNIQYGYEQISARSKYELSKLLLKISQGQCLVIEDPFLHNETQEFLSSLLMNLRRLTLELNPFQVVLFVQDHAGRKEYSLRQNGNAPSEKEEKEMHEFREKFAALEQFALAINEAYGELMQVHVEKTTHKMHDRNIYSNTYWISCESGFCEQYKSPTKWNFHPLGLYYSGYHQKLKDITYWLRSQNIAHPLLQG